MSLVSIIIPNFNHASYLKKRIDSVLNQSFEDFEVILLDDASNDFSVDLIETYRGHPKVSNIVYNHTNSGSAFSQWQKGIGLAKGKYIWIAESDDYCEPDFLSSTLDVFNKNPQVGIVYTRTSAIDSDGNVQWTSPECKEVKVMHGLTFVKEKMVRECSIFNASMAIFNRAILPSDFEIIKSFKFCGDWLFWILIAEKCEVAYVGRILNYFRNHDRDLSSKSYSSGIFFDEYYKIICLLYHRGIISSVEKRKSLYFKIGLINDTLVPAPEIRLRLKNQYMSELRKWECYKWDFEKTILNRIKVRLNRYFKLDLKLT